jgi:translocation and assembly module TamB
MDERPASSLAATPASAGSAPGAPSPRRALTVASAIAAALLALVIAVVAALWWGLRTEPGSAWLVSMLPGVQVEAPKGTLLGDFDAQRVVVRLPGGQDTVTLTEVGWRGLTLRRAAAPAWVHIGIESLAARRVDVAITPSKSTSPLQAPADLRLPVEVDLRSLRVGELHASTLGQHPLRDIAARVQLGADAGATHRVERLMLGWDRLQASGDARIDTTAPMALSATIRLSQQAAAALPAWDASATVEGPLAAPRLQATVRAAATSERPPQTLDARVTLRPFAPWPLGDLQASTKGLDLAAFSSAAPTTALTIEAVATSTAADRPARVAIELANPLAGRWNEGRLPLRQLQLELAGRPDQPGELELRRFDAELGTAQARGGGLTGQGRWSAERWEVSAVLNGLQPGLLDARAPVMRLSGPLTLTGGGASAAGGVDVSARLAGELADRGPVRAAQLTLEAGVSPRRIGQLAGEAGTHVDSARGASNCASCWRWQTARACRSPGWPRTRTTPRHGP